MADLERFEFRLPGYTPETMPLDRLLEYLGQLMIILGHPSDLHLVEIQESSTKPIIAMPHHAAVKARHRARETWEGGGSARARDAYRHIRHMVADDGGKPAILASKEGTVIEFPSVDLGADQEIGSVRQPSVVAGELIRVGGDAENAQILIKDISGAITSGCFCNKEMAKSLAPLIYQFVRLHGIASWHRNRNGEWKLTRMNVHSFEPLDGGSISEAITEIQTVTSDWPADINEKLLKLRQEPAK